MDLRVNSNKELYELLLPVLETKEIQMRRSDLLGISKKDIWEYLNKKVWINSNNLKLYQMVDDILKVDIVNVDSDK